MATIERILNDNREFVYIDASEDEVVDSRSRVSTEETQTEELSDGVVGSC